MRKSDNKFFLVFMLLAFICSPVIASETQPAFTTRQQDINISLSTMGNGTASAPLKGGVQKVELDLEKLRDVGLDLKEILRAASSLYDEVTIQPMRIITQPTMIGSGTIINIPVGKQPVGPPQPARKERVDLAINGMKPIINLLKKNVDDFVEDKKQLDLPDNVMTKLESRFKEWIDAVNKMAAKQIQLEQITQSPPYDNKAIADLTASIQTDVKNLDKTRLAIYKVVRKEGKR